MYVAHIVPCEKTSQSKKGEAIRSLIRREFEKGRNEEDPEQIEALKAKYVESADGVTKDVT